MSDIVTVISDDEGGQSQFLSPTVLEAAHGVSQAVLAAIARQGMVMVGEGGQKIKVPEKLSIKIYKAQLDEEKKKVLGHTVQKLMKAEIRFYPERFEGLKRAPSEEPVDGDLESMVKLA